MKKIYNKKEINKALDISVNIKGGGKVNLKPLASVADSIEGNISSNAFTGTSGIANEVLPIEFCYIEVAEDDDMRPSERVKQILSQNYGVNYYVELNNDGVFLTSLANGEYIQLPGPEIKNVMFDGVYERNGHFMDLDYPNSFMDETVGLHQIMITNPNLSKAICSVSNKRLIALLVTGKHGGALEVPVEVEGEVGVQYNKAKQYRIYVLYDLKVEKIIQAPINQ